MKKWYYPLMEEGRKLLQQTGYEKQSLCIYQVIGEDRVIEAWYCTKKDDPVRVLVELHYAKDTQIFIFELKMTANRTL